MFKLIIPFNQVSLIEALRKRLDQNPNLANMKMHFLPGAPTLMDLWDQNKGGWCFGACASIMEHLEAPEFKPRAGIQSCIEAFKGGIKEVQKKLVYTLSVQAMQLKAERAAKQIEDLNECLTGSSFSMWAMEFAKDESSLHAIFTSNNPLSNNALDAYFVYDPNAGVFQSTSNFTKELEYLLKKALASGMPKGQAMLDVVRIVTLNFANCIKEYRSLIPSFTKNAPYISGKDIANALKTFKAQMGPIISNM